MPRYPRILPRLPLLALIGSLSFTASGCAGEQTSPPQEKEVGQPVMLLPDVADIVAVAVGQPVPSWELVTLDGKLLKSEDLLGKVVVLDIWATWCAPCIYEIPGYVDMQGKYADQGLVIVGISADRAGPAAVQRFVKRYKVSYPIGMATAALMDTLIKADDFPLPTTLLIDRKGILRHAKVGAFPHDEYEKLITDIL